MEKGGKWQNAEQGIVVKFDEIANEERKKIANKICEVGILTKPHNNPLIPSELFLGSIRLCIAGG